MTSVELSGEEWGSVIAVPREKALPSVLEQANVIAAQLERHGPNASTVRLRPCCKTCMPSWG
jgi:hypothetical protein